MIQPIDQFIENMRRVKHLGGLHQSLTSMTTAVLDASDLLRAQYVLTVSALDHYIHEIVRVGMMETFDKVRTPTPAYLKFRVAVDTLDTNLASMRANFETEILEQHSYKAFQQPDKIADALRLITTVPLWKSISGQMAMSESDLVARLRLIVQRRNQIAHEADLDPTYPNTRWPIDSVMVKDVLGFIEMLGHAIDKVVISPYVAKVAPKV